MSSSGNRRIVGALVVAFFALGGLVSPLRSVRADGDDATRIYQLARRLHQEDTVRGGFTLWVNGDIGDDLTARLSGVHGGDPLPEFTFTALNGEGKLRPKDLKGPTILNFWASWCSTCRNEIPRFISKMNDKSLSVPVIFVNILDYKLSADTFIHSLDAGDNLTVVVDPQSSFYNDMVMSVVPDTILVDAQGRVQAIQIGEMSDVALAFFDEIAAHPGVGSFDRLHPDAQPISL